MNTRLMLLFVVLAVLTGCSATYDPARLLKPSSNKPIVIQPLMVGSLFINGQSEVITLAGTYRPEYENSTGVFYKGSVAIMPPFTLNPQMKRGPSPDRINGGIWVSNCSTLPVTQSRELRVYIVEKKIDDSGIERKFIEIINAGLDRNGRSDAVFAQLPSCSK